MSFTIEKIRPEFDLAICTIIKATGAEFGAIGEGFGPSDLEVSHMSQHYQSVTKSLYLVALIGDKVVGGCGIASFEKSSVTCELRKLFLQPTSRGLGIGKALTKQCLDFAKSQGFERCYLDTCSNMDVAIKLYENIDFKHLAKPLAGTKHNGCDVWMLKQL
jgi:putative acetyltransferase